MTTDEYHLLTLGEEGCEVGLQVSKAMRFGLDEIYHIHDKSNADRLTLEVADLIAVYELCVARKLIKPVTQEMIDAKKIKFFQYLEHAREQQTINDVLTPT